MVISMIKRVIPRPKYAIMEWLTLGGIIILADLVTQRIEHNKELSKTTSTKDNDIPSRPFNINYSRMKGVAVTALGFLSPIAILWYPFLHRLMARRFSHLAEGTVKYVMTKTALENVLLPAPVCLGYFVIPAAVEGGHQWEVLPHKLSTDFAPSVVVDTVFWCALSPLNYRFVSLKFQPLFSCVVDGVEAAGLSFLTHCDDFKWPSLRA